MALTWTDYSEVFRTRNNQAEGSDLPGDREQRRKLYGPNLCLQSPSKGGDCLKFNGMTLMACLECTGI